MMNYHERIFCLCKLSGYRPSPTSPKYFNKAASKANNIISRQLHISFCYKPSLTLISIHPACTLLSTHLSYAVCCWFSVLKLIATTPHSYTSFSRSVGLCWLSSFLQSMPPPLQTLCSLVPTFTIDHSVICKHHSSSQRLLPDLVCPVHHHCKQNGTPSWSLM